MEGGKEISLHQFLADRKIKSLWKKCVLGLIVCCETHSDYGPPKMPLK